MKNFLVYVEDKTKFYAAEEQRLVSEERKDEANIMRIRQNVYGIAKSMYEVAVKLAPENIKDDVAKRLGEILATWEGNYKIVTEHNDTEKILAEETKLGTLREIFRYLETAE